MSKKFDGNDSVKKTITQKNKKALANADVVNLAAYRQAVKQTNSKTILIVDDEPITRTTLKKIFENEEHTVLTAKDGMELAKIIESIKLDLILLDIQLPWINGNEICAIIRENEHYKNLPIAMISGINREEEIQKSFDAGCNDFITKPFEVETLKQVVNKLLFQTN